MQRSHVSEITTTYEATDPQGSGRTTMAANSAEVGTLWWILWSRAALVLAVVIVCGLSAAAYCLIAPSEFTATAQILIDPRDKQIVSKDVTPDTLAADGGVLQVESQSRVIESDEVLLRAVRALDLAHDKDYGGKVEGPIGRLVAPLLRVITGSSEDDGPGGAENRALRVLRKHLSIKRADKVFVVDVVFVASSGAKAASVADAISEAYLTDQIQARADASTRASKALASRLEELRKGVETAADQVEQFKAAHDLLGTDRQLISDQQLNDNGAQLNSARAKVGELQARVDQLDTLRRTGGDAGAVPEAIQSNVITQLRASQSELTRRRSDMRTRFGQRYPDMIAIDAEINQTRSLISGELDRLVRSAHSDLDRAKKNVQALTSAQDVLKNQTVSRNQAFVTLGELVRDLDTRRTVYQTFLARASETKEQSSIDSTNARIISRAIPPVLPSWPLRPILVLGAIAGGLGVGAALAFVLEYLAPRLLSVGQLEAATGAPVIGVVSSGVRRLRSPFPGRRTPEEASPRNLATRLAVSRLCGPPASIKLRSKPLTVLVTSARGATGAGGSVAAGLVLAAAESGVSTLLIDVAPGAGDATGAGFLNVLGGESSLKSVIARDSRSGIFRLGLGTAGEAAGRVMVPERLENFVALAGRNFDLIVFDAGVFTDNLDATPLAAAADDVLFVARRGVTLRKEAEEAAEAVTVSAGRPITAALLIDGPDRA